MQRAALIELRPIGWVASPLRDPDAAPKQGDEGAPEALISLEPGFLEALKGIHAGDAILVFTWLDRADRDVLVVHPRGDATRERQGVFATRSPDRPNPIGLHRVRVESIDGDRIRVSELEALDGTPVLDLKPLLSTDIDER
jgi:tRNA-Thr(GGU) m(6)t(6)A37 methyltransferase TsaA